MRFFLLIFKNLRRNKLRSILTALAVVALVAIYSMIITVIIFLDDLMAEKNKDVKVIITERYRLLSMFDRRHMEDIVLPGKEPNSELRQVAGFDPARHTIWQFVGFTLDPDKKDKDLQFFAIATIPEKIATMTDGLEGFDPKLADLMKHPPRSRLDNAGIIVGKARLKKLNKQVGDVFKAICTLHRDGSGLRLPIEMELEIVGEFPADSRWSEGVFMDSAYLDRTLKLKNNEFEGKINYGWLQLDDQDGATKTSTMIEQYIPELKCETAASAYGRFMAPLKNMLWGIKYVLVPAILCVMTLVLANTFSITVRERQTEMAVLKVLGFGTRHIVTLVLGEAVVVGALAGMLGAVCTVVVVNLVLGGIPLGNFPLMRVPLEIFWWGPALGTCTALLGGIIPAWSARGVQVAQVFAGTA